MIRKGFTVDENMSNLTSSASGTEASVSSGTNQNPPHKKKRNLPGNPDPDAEVIALSPKSLLATNRFICEICNKGFQREQNLQLHRRGHNLPWKLKQRSNKEVVRKKVYVCPESTCVHHDPVRALGDLTGIKKHFCRKHGEKKWKCEKCSKKYAVQSDWKAHSKICGTREYRCDCGTLFSRRDSFITHRAFCDALAVESGRGVPITGNPFLPLQLQPASVTTPSSSSAAAAAALNLSQSDNSQTQLSSNSFFLKRELQDHQHQQIFNNTLRSTDNIPPWLSCPNPSPSPSPGPPPPPPPPPIDLSPSLFPTYSEQLFIPCQNPNPNPNPTLSSFHRTIPSSSQMYSATALLQKAAQMGVSMSQQHQPSSSMPLLPNSKDLGTGFDLPPFIPHDDHMMMMMSSNSLSTSTSNLGESFDAYREYFTKAATETAGLGRQTDEGNGSGGGGGGKEDLTRDFLGLGAISQRDFLDMAGLHRHMNHSSPPSYKGENQNGTLPWQ